MSRGVPGGVVGFCQDRGDKLTGHRYPPQDTSRIITGDVSALSVGGAAFIEDDDACRALNDGPVVPEGPLAGAGAGLEPLAGGFGRCVCCCLVFGEPFFDLRGER